MFEFAYKHLFNPATGEWLQDDEKTWGGFKGRNFFTDGEDEAIGDCAKAASAAGIYTVVLGSNDE